MRKIICCAVIGAVSALACAAPAHAEGLSAAAQAAISQYRQQHGLPAVTADARLMQLAAEQARAMAAAGVLGHDVGRPFAARIVSYNPEVAAENIAAGTTTFPATLDMWKRSPGHNANLLRRGVTHFGIASAEAPESRYKVFWSLIVAGPRDPRVRTARGAPGTLRAAPSQGPVVRVRAEAPPASSPDLVTGLKKMLRPLWQGANPKEK